MSDEPFHAEHHHAHVVVHPVQTDSTGRYRRVDILGEHVGKAYKLADVVEFCRRAGLHELDLDAERMVEWIGGGSHVWE